MPPNSEKPALTNATIRLFAFACGAVIANIYYSQPLLATIALGFGRPPAHLGFLVTLTQLGYACGLFLIVPLGDVVDRRKLIVRLLLASTMALFAVAASTNFLIFVLANLCVGLTTCAAQLLVPFAASLAHDKDRGRVVGTVMSGLLLGILLARTVSGAIAQLSHWRVVYCVAALSMLLLACVLSRALPGDRRDVQLCYSALMASLWSLVRSHPVLRLRSWYGALVFACFSVLWTGLTMLLSQPPYGFSEGKIGLFGLAGAAGAWAANQAGRLADRGQGNLAAGLFAGTVLISFALIAGGSHSLIALLLGILLLDIGVQGLHISNQSAIYALAPHARSRITTVYLTSYFIGGALGSGAASVAYAASGWYGVCLVGAAFAGLLVALWLATFMSQRPTAPEAS